MAVPAVDVSVGVTVKVCVIVGEAVRVPGVSVKVGDEVGDGVLVAVACWSTAARTSQPGRTSQTRASARPISRAGCVRFCGVL